MSTILLIIGGSISAYKSLEIIQLLRRENISVKVILTSEGERFITPLSCSALSGHHVYSDVFSLVDETKTGHIHLSREACLVLVAPATADLIAKAAQGRADDLASLIFLTTKAPLLIAPSMNEAMWNHPATQLNIEILKQRGVGFIGPEEGDFAYGERGFGHLVDPFFIRSVILQKLFGDQPLKGIKALVTAGPTQEPIDPVRYISNVSSGRQGYAIAEALLQKGANVTLITGPTSLIPPSGAHVVRIQTAEDMWKATDAYLPADIVICVAAVADWSTNTIAQQKIKKKGGFESLRLKVNKDILASLANHKLRPRLLIGFAAETENIIENAKKKLNKCDWIVANDVSQGVFNSDKTQVHWITKNSQEFWPRSSKKEVATKLISYICSSFENDFLLKQNKK